MAVAAASIFAANQAAPAAAYPMFARRYGFSCQTCHTVLPRLNAFGESFRAAGYRLAAPLQSHDTLPVSVKANFAYTSGPDPARLPKALVDEVELLSAGPLGRHWSYHLEQYAVDGGVPGKTRDAWLMYDRDPQRAWRPRPPGALTVSAKFGEFTLPLPDDPETFRPTANHYAVFDQTIGRNPFNFFDARIGLEAALAGRHGEAHVLVLRAHDPQSGLPASGTDRMFALQQGPPELSLYAYRFEGNRPLRPIADEFWRNGFAIESIRAKARFAMLVQTGSDSSAGGGGERIHSSGGYVQQEWAFGTRLLGVVRYDGVNASDGSFLRLTTLSLVLRPYRRVRWTIEDVVSHQPRTKHTLNIGWLVAY